MKVPCGGFDLDESVFNVDKNSKQVKLNSPISYDYMPEGYPSKSVETVTLMEEQKVSPFTDAGEGLMSAASPVNLELADGDELTVVWDGASYNTVVTMIQGQYPAFGNLGLAGMGDVTDYPFLYLNIELPIWATADTAASHTIKVTATKMIYNTIDVNMLPKAGEGYGVVKKDEIVTAYVFPDSDVPADKMNKAVDDFAAGKAKITWWGDNIIFAERVSDREIKLVFANDPGNVYTYSTFGDDHPYYEHNNSPEYVKSSIDVHKLSMYTFGKQKYVFAISGVKKDSEDGYIMFGNQGTRIYEDGIAIKSSDSSKMFKITVNDSGAISATEVT